MNYQETLEYLYTAAPAFEKVGAGAYKEGLTTTKTLDAHFDHPHKNYHTIHVAGTNGKGSVSHTLAAILQAAGYRVGLYTSPHLVDFAERIRVNGRPIDHQYVVDFVENERGFFETLSPSFFELTTAMAFKYFADEQVDIAVVEVGLGGRLDCTNIISPMLSIITNISFDHTGFLGNTLAKIAGEKAGIIKPGVPVIIGEYTPETRPVFEAKAREVGSPIIFAQDCQYVTSSRQNVLLSGSNEAYGPTDGPLSFGRVYETKCYGKLKGELGGDCQERNVNTILCSLLPLARAMKRVGLPVCKDQSVRPMEALRTALGNVCSMTGLMGRWQKLSDEPLVICDTGHNLAGWQLLAKQILSTAKWASERAQLSQGNAAKSRLRIVFGMVDDKDVDSVLALLPREATYYFTQAETHRAIPVAELEHKAQKQGLTGKMFQSVWEAFESAKKDSSPSDFIFVGGSSYVVADLLTKNYAELP